MPISDTNLVTTLAEATQRHDETLNAYKQSVQQLFTEISQLLSALKTPGNFGSKKIFNVRTDPNSGMPVLIIKNELTGKNHYEWANVLNFQSTGLGYTPTNGTLCGFIQVILSSGDYWAKLRRSQNTALLGMVTGAATEYSRRQMDAYEGISRESLDILWREADKPNKWFKFDTDQQVEQVSVKDYIYYLVDQIYNPEHKEWTYKASS